MNIHADAEDPQLIDIKIDALEQVVHHLHSTQAGNRCNVSMP